MTKLIGVCLLFLGLITTAVAQVAATGATQPPTTTINVNPAPTGATGAPPAAAAGSSAPSYGFWVTYGAMTAVLVIFMVVIVVSLRVLVAERCADGRQRQWRDRSPALAWRLIALLGFVVIISIYLGIGYSVIFQAVQAGGRSWRPDRARHFPR